MDKKIILKKSENIKLNQYFTSSEVHCKCLRAACDQSIISEKLLDCLLRFRSKVKIPLHLTNVYRCKEHNTDVLGVKNSTHCKGEAADVSIINLINKFDVEIIIEIAKSSGFTFIKYYPEKHFLHLDVRDLNKRI